MATYSTRKLTEDEKVVEFETQLKHMKWDIWKEPNGTFVGTPTIFYILFYSILYSILYIMNSYFKNKPSKRIHLAINKCLKQEEIDFIATNKKTLFKT